MNHKAHKDHKGTALSTFVTFRTFVIFVSFVVPKTTLVTFVRFVIFVVPVISVVLVSSSAPPQGGPAPALPTNLQALPKDTSPQDVLALMQQFTEALGVQCTYCHVQAVPRQLTPEETAAAENQGQSRGRGRGRGQGPPPINFASDDKTPKLVAREMIRMVNDINGRLTTRLGKPAPEVVRVRCVTCHRGVTQPQQLADILSQTMLTKGDGAAIAMYRDLRLRYYGAQAYDFREPLLITLAEQSTANNKPDDAAAWLQLNVELYPKSVSSYLALAQVHIRKKDTGAAVRALEKALELDPNNDGAKRQLAALKK